MEGVVEFVNCFGMGFELEIVVEAVFKNEGILWGHGVVGFSGVLLDVEKVLDDVDTLGSLTDHEENWTHEPDLVPEEGIADEVEVVDFIAIVQF